MLSVPPRASLTQKLWLSGLVLGLVGWGLLGRLAVFRDSAAALLSSWFARFLIVTGGTLVLGLEIKWHWRTILAHENGMFVVLYIMAAMAMVSTRQSYPLVWAFAPPIVVRLVEAVCRVCGCCRGKATSAQTINAAH